MKRALVLSLLSAALVAGGCSVGPNYVRPDAPTSDSFKELEGWRTARPRDDVLRAAWWDWPAASITTHARTIMAGSPGELEQIARDIGRLAD